MTSNNLVTAINKMGEESNALFEKSQTKSENNTTKFLIEALAKAKFDQMTAGELTAVMNQSQKPAIRQ